jgi:hypothetical protein
MPRTVTILLALLALSGAVATAGVDAPGPVNLIATPAVKAQLHAAFMRLHSTIAPRRIRGPLEGRTYYGRYGSTKYAVATFSIDGGTDDQPELFRHRSGGAWRDLGDTGGEVCPGRIPMPLIKLWRFLPTSFSIIRGKRVYCYAPPA